MNNLTTRKIVLGMLITFVLAFSVQGIADALTLSKIRGDFQTKPAGSPFEITFSVSLDSNSTKIYNTNGQQTDEHGNTIDGSGYLVRYIGSTTYRFTRTDSLSDANSQENNSPATGTVTTATGLTGTLKIRGPNDRTSTAFGTQYSLDAAGNVYIDGSRNVVDEDGKAVYIEVGRSTDDDEINDEWSYTRAKADPIAPYSSNAPQRYAYNDEQITITGSETRTAVFRVDRSLRYRLWASDAAANARTATLEERDQNVGIPSTIILRIETGDTAGTHTVTISDDRDASPDRTGDYPVPKPVVDPITFTLYTTSGTGDPDSTATVTVAPGDRSQSTSLTTLEIDHLYTLSGTTTDDILLVYQVIEGPGTVYLGEYDEPSNTPTTSLVTSEAADVFVYLNGGDSKVRVYVDGADPIDDGATVTFNYTGTDRRSPGQQQNQQNQQNQQQTTGSLNITVSGTGATRSVTVTATSAVGTVTAIPVVLTGTALGSTQTVTTGTATEITLPTAPGTYTLTATASVAGYNPDTETITVAGPTSLGTISITQIGAPTNGLQTFSVTVVDTNGNRISGALAVTVSGSGFTTSSVPTANGSGAVNITLPTTAGSYTLTARATDYTSGTTTVRIAGTTPTTTPTPTTTTPTTPTTPTVSEPDSVSIVGPSQRDGTANTALDAALIVEVVDDDGDAVADARVIFRVRTGQGRLSDRGNGRAIAVQTNSSGHARATYTPMSASSTVEAEVRGVTRSVTFTITASGGSTTPTTRDTGTGTTPGTISPTVLIGAANRAPMVWIDGGAIYSLVGASVERFAPSVDNAQNLAVGGGKVYWTEATGESGGTINSANLNGSGVTELASILATPMGIAIDTAGSKLYWTNSRGKIQSANLNGSGITDVIPSGLEGAMDIALAGGNAYWTQGGNVRFVNLRGQKQIRNVSTGTDTAGSLAIAGGKVYWTEATGESGGTVNSANLNGSGATQLASILATPSGIAVDTARSKLLWTNARGRIQSANLDGSGITNVVDGLGSPGDMVLSNSISAPAATTTTTTTTTTTASKAKYDVNGDGSVDNTDASLVAAAMNTTNAKYDVNSDGVVNFLDLLLVFDNRDATAASAPTIVGMKLTAVQIDVLQEQINLLIATGDRSPAAMRTLVYLQQLIATARPEQTQLLANYPNPFNPETWIPYELATDTEVRITIYNTQGVVIRTLELGHQSSGYYVGRDRAAYWDGRNAFGEQVASGIYFYQFETDETSSMRKMVILK